MRFTFGYPTQRLDPPAHLLTAQAIGGVAQCVEDAGFESISFTEHPAPVDTWRTDYGHDALDPFVALSFAAAATEQLRLFSHLAVLPYRSPFLLAKTVASLDRLSEGRVILGVGAGYLRGEFDALGVVFDDRNRLVDEALHLLRMSFSGLPVQITTPTVHANDVVSLPTPLQRPHPPIWIGGNSRLSRRRVARDADGWCPVPTNPAQAMRRRTAVLEDPVGIAQMVNEIRSDRQRIGRPEEFDVMFNPWQVLPGCDLAALEDQIDAFGAAGVTVLGLSVVSEDLAEIKNEVARIGERLIRSRLSPTPGPLIDLDRAEIVRLYHLLARALDTQDFDSLAGLFTEDVIADCDEGIRVSGIAELIRMARQRFSAFTATRHCGIDFVINIEGRTARARVTRQDKLVRRDCPGGEECVVSGFYEDELRIIEGGWRIASHKSVTVLTEGNAAVLSLGAERDSTE